MVAQDLRHRLALGEPDHSLDASLETREVLDVQPPRIEAVSGQQNGCIPVEQSDAHRAVPRNWDHIDHTRTQIYMPNIRWPVLDPVETFRRFNLRRNKCQWHRRIFDRLYLRVAPSVILVFMRVH